MTPQDLMLDYVLGQLEGPDLAAFEAAIARDPALLGQANRLKRALDALLDDGDPLEAPGGLADRTVATVAERKGRRAILDFVPARVPFRWADVAVAAGILMAGLLTLLPAVKSARDKMSQAGCGFNLQQLYSGLANYANRHQHYPSVCGQDQGAPAGSYALKLDDEDLLRDPKNLHCPCRGACPESGPRPDLAHIDYAYHVGFRKGETGLAEPASPQLGTVIPILADQPPHDDRTIFAGNSPNHGARGQNVLFSDGHLQWLPTRRVGPMDPDLFLNNNSRPEPGIGVHDSALVPARFLVDTTN